MEILLLAVTIFICIRVGTPDVVCPELEDSMPASRPVPVCVVGGGQVSGLVDGWVGVRVRVCVRACVRAYVRVCGCVQPGQ